MITARDKTQFDSLRAQRKRQKGILALLTYIESQGANFQKDWEEAINLNNFKTEDAMAFKRFFESWERMSDMVTVALDDARTFRKKNGANFDVDIQVRYVEALWSRLKQLSKVVNEEIDKFREKRML